MNFATKEEKKMAKKRGHGEGTIYQRKNGLWCTQVTVGYNGKKRNG